MKKNENSWLLSDQLIHKKVKNKQKNKEVNPYPKGYFFMDTTTRSIEKRDESANGAISFMVSTVVATAVIPAAVNWTLTATALAGGVVKIANAYDISLGKEDGWKLVKQIFIAAGTWWISLNIGGKFITSLLQLTGLGYGAAIAMDAIVSGASAWAIGNAAKAFFKTAYQGRKMTDKELGNIFKEEFMKYKKSHS